MGRFKIASLLVFHQLGIYLTKLSRLIFKRRLRSTAASHTAATINNRIIVEAAEQLGVTLRELPHQYLELKHGSTVCYSNSALEFFIAQKRPMFVKPCSGTSTGVGISLAISSRSAFANAFSTVSRNLVFSHYYVHSVLRKKIL